MGKQRAIELRPNNTYAERVLKTDANKLKTGKKEDVEYEPLCVFTEQKPRTAFYRGAKKLVFYVDGHVKAIRFGKTTEELQTTWTKKEATAHVKKEVTKSASDVKPLKMWQFIVIVAFLVLQTILILNLGGYIRLGR